MCEGASMCVCVCVCMCVSVCVCVCVRALQARRIPTGPDTLSPFGLGSGRFLFLQIGLRSGSGSFSFSPCIVPKYAQTVNMLFPPFSVRLEYGSSGLKVWLAHALVQRRARAVRGRGL